MTRVRSLSMAVIVFALTLGVAQASWYDDYDAGIAAARAGNWNVVLQKMNAAIRGNANENNKARTYGAIFINYKPYYYRGIANLNLGNYEAAIADLERTQGPGEVNLGPIETHLSRAKSRLEAAAPEPQPPAPVPQPRVQPAPPPLPVPVPAPQPVVPQMDPAVRQRASAAVQHAKERLTAAQQRRATGSPQYSQAVQGVADANARLSTARTNDELEAARVAAENAALFADAAVAPGLPQQPVTPAPIPRSAAAVDAVLSDYSRQLRGALNNYFAGEFESAARDFESLSRALPRNGWIWAFLGASQYSVYAFEADEAYRRKAIDSFKKAKQYRSWKGGLPEKYFSKRIRRFFESAT